MDVNKFLDATVICTDIHKLTDVAKSAIDHALEVVKLLPSPIPTDSKLYESLEAIRGVPLESASRSYTDVGIQADFINQDPEETNTSDDYEMINIPSDKELIAKNPSKIEITEAKEDDVTKSDKVIEMEINCHDEATIEPKLVDTSELKYSEDFRMDLKKFEDNVKLLDECAILLSKVKSEQETDIETDTELLSMKSCKSILKLLKRKEYSETNDDTSLVSTCLKTLDGSVVIPNEPKNSEDINELCVTVTEVYPDIKSDTEENIEETMKQDTVNYQKSPDMMANEEKTATNSTSDLNNTSNKGDSILDLVKPKNYKPKPREDSIFVCEEDVKKCLKIAEKAMAEHNYDKAKRMAEKAERIHATPAAKKLLEQIATEAKEEAESFYNQARKQLKRKNFDEALESATKSQKAAKLDKTETLKKEIIEAKNIHIHTETVMNTSDSGYREVDEALNLITQAKMEMKDKNMKRAEQLLVQSIKIHSTESANELLHEMRKCETEQKRDHNFSIIDGDGLTQAQKCITVAEKAMKDNNLKKAEHFLEKSIRIAPSTEATKMLEKVRGLKKIQAWLESQLKTSVDENKNDEFEKCIELAWNAIAEDNLKEAERFLDQAERMQPTEECKVEMLEGLQHGLKDRKDEHCAQRDIEYYEELLTTCAKTAIDDEDYEIAEVVLTNAWIRHKSLKAKQMLGQVETARYYSKKEFKDFRKLKEAAEKCVKLIEDRWQTFIPTEKMAQNVFCVLIAAQNTYPTVRGIELMTTVRNLVVMQLYNKDWIDYEWNYEKKTRSEQSFKCNCYVEMAERAYETGNYAIAKEFLEEADILVRAKDIKQLIRQVNEASKK